MATSNYPKVSIVIPVYNGSNYLKYAIDSALAQTYKNIEVLVIDDGSRDDGKTESIARSYGERISYYQKNNGGVASALNYGIERMSGSYFSWLSHDDLYEPTKIEEEVRFIRSSYDDRTIVACNSSTLLKNNVKKKTFIDPSTFEYFDIFLALSADTGVNGCSLLIPKQALIESGGFNENLPFTQDYDLWFRLSKIHKYRFALLQKNLVEYRIHAGQDSIQKQKLCLEAGDNLRTDILSTIGYSEFADYIKQSTAHKRYAKKAYELYKERGYKKLSSMLLLYFLRYFRVHEPKVFYEMYTTELDTPATKTQPTAYGLIDLECDKVIKSAILPIKIKFKKKSRQPQNKLFRIFWLVKESIVNDGVYLTVEKLAKAVYFRILKR